MDTQTAPAAKQKGIKKLWLKIRASMKNDSSSKAVTVTSSPKSPVATTSKASPDVPKPTETVTAPAQTPSTAVTKPTTEPKPEAKTEDEPKPTTMPAMTADAIEVDEDVEPEDKISLPPIRSASGPSTDKEAVAIRYRRAQEVFQKYDMTLEPSDWQQQDKSTVDRIEKKPRMRVRYTCHQCKTTFGREKKCSTCFHTRCDSCIRYPPKKADTKSKQQKKVVEDPSTLVTPTTGACHECKTTFDLGATSCENCNHSICSRCLQETVVASPATAPPPAQPVAVGAAA